MGNHRLSHRGAREGPSGANALGELEAGFAWTRAGPRRALARVWRDAFRVWRWSFEPSEPASIVRSMNRKRSEHTLTLLPDSPGSEYLLVGRDVPIWARFAAEAGGPYTVGQEGAEAVLAWLQKYSPWPPERWPLRVEPIV